MKKTKIFYWIITALFSAFMLFTAVPDVLYQDEAVVFMKQLGYPGYFIPFIGVAKVLGSIAILIPGFPRIKEWAYAGLAFDLIGAIYSVLAIGTPPLYCLPLLIPVVLGIVSYILNYKLQKAAVN